MRYFLRFLLALVMAALLVVTYGSIQAVGHEHLQLEKVANMTSQESNHSNQFKQNGLQLEINGPGIVALSIPENKPGVTAPLSFTVSVTNNTQAPIPFIDDDALIPEILGPNGQALHRREPINRQVGFGEYYGSLIGIGEEIAISIEGRLSWENNLLQLTGLKQTLPSPDDIKIPIDSDNSWSFDTLGPGEYKIRFTYETPTGTILYPDRVTFIQTRQEMRMEVTGTSHLVTPLANFRLIQPVGLNNSAVEVDGIHFETFIPEPLLTMPNQRRNARNPVQIGMRITNNTPTPFYFSFYGTFTPDLVMPDGQVQQGAYISDWMRFPEESDYLLATPGESVTFFPSITLSWEHDKFSLLVSNGYGGLSPFDLKPGIYQLRFRYENTSDSTQKTDFTGEPLEDWLIKIIEKVWNGRVDTPFVEFRLAQP